MKIFFMTSDDATKYLEDYGEDFGVNVQIAQEDGPWNRVFMSIWYRVYGYALSAIVLQLHLLIGRIG